MGIKLQDWKVLLLGLFLIGAISACSTVKINSDNMPKDVPLSAYPGAIPDRLVEMGSAKGLLYYTTSSTTTVEQWYSHMLQVKGWKVTSWKGTFKRKTEAKKGDEKVRITIEPHGTKTVIIVTW